MSEQVPSKELDRGTNFCRECGMHISSPTEFHPYAACLMFKACGDPDAVAANLTAVVDHGRRTERERHAPEPIPGLNKAIEPEKYGNGYRVSLIFKSEEHAAAAYLDFDRNAPTKSVVDACEICAGSRGGVPGNENIVESCGEKVTMCDYCSADEMRRPGFWKEGPTSGEPDGQR